MTVSRSQPHSRATSPSTVTHPRVGEGVPTLPPGGGVRVVAVVGVVLGGGGAEPTPSPLKAGGITANPTEDSNRDGPQA